MWDAGGAIFFKSGQLRHDGGSSKTTYRQTGFRRGQIRLLRPNNEMKQKFEITLTFHDIFSTNSLSGLSEKMKLPQKGRQGALQKLRHWHEPLSRAE